MLGQQRSPGVPVPKPIVEADLGRDRWMEDLHEGADCQGNASQLHVCACGVVDHGFFIGMTTAVIIAGKEGISVKKAKE